jgi:hypothetical protein
MDMSIKAASSVLLLVVVAGCTQPTGPSMVNDVSAIPDAMPRSVIAAPIRSAAGGRPASGGAVYVTSQGLYYDTFAARDPLPMQGKFQLLEDGATEFGPGDPGYLGGRWWEDLNDNEIQDEGDHFFLCPLLGPGRLAP